MTLSFLPATGNIAARPNQPSGRFAAIVPHHTVRALYELERQAKARGDLVALILLDGRIRAALRAA